MNSSKYPVYHPVYSDYYDDNTSDIDAFYEDARRMPVTEIPPPVPVKPKPKTVDLSDWRTWAHKEPGHCPCGISREDCTYHK